MNFFTSLARGTKLKTAPYSKALKFNTQRNEICNDEGVGDQHHPTAPEDLTLWRGREDIQAYRKLHQIRIHHRVQSSTNNNPQSDTLPPPIRTFQELLSPSSSKVLPLPKWLIDNVLQMCKFSIPTPIQMQAIPCILKGQNLLASAPTGSGKTLAYLLPIICLLRKPSKGFIRALVTCPSRELASQIHRNFKVLVHGQAFRSRLVNNALPKEVQKGHTNLDFAVTTPLTAVRLCQEGRIELRDVVHLVVDEADKLLDSGFAPQLDSILAQCTNPVIQRLFFSATLPENVVELCNSVVHGAPQISVGEIGAAPSKINQSVVFMNCERDKIIELRRLIHEGRVIPPTLIFVQSNERADELGFELAYDGLYIGVTHSDKTSKDRDAIMKAFRLGQIWVLITTDILSRGLDYKAVNVVINYDFPQSAAAYIHRIGRTGRAGSAGDAITYVTPEDITYLHIVVGVMRQSGCHVPEWMLSVKKPSSRDKHKLQVSPLKRPKSASPADHQPTWLRKRMKRAKRNAAK